MTISQLEDTYIQDLNSLDDWFLQYEYLLELSADLPKMEPGERTEERRVPGCQSGVWLILAYQDGKIHIRADSDSLIIRGILAIYVDLLDGRTPDEIVHYKPRFIEETNIKQQISSDRFHGLNMVLKKIQEFSSACCDQE